MKKLLLFFGVGLSIFGTTSAMKNKYDFDISDQESSTKKFRPQAVVNIPVVNEIPDIEDLFKDQVITQENYDISNEAHETDEHVEDGSMVIILDYKYLDHLFFEAVHKNKLDEVRHLLNNDEYLNHLSYDMLQLASDGTSCISMKRILEWAIDKKFPEYALQDCFLKLHV